MTVYPLRFKACILSFCASQGMVAGAFIFAGRLEVGSFFLFGSVGMAAAVLRGWPMARSLKRLNREVAGL